MSQILKKPFISGCSTHRIVLVRALLAFCVPFGIYWLTLAPTVYNLDSAELTTAAATLGITRATGYPLYILVGHLWSYLPLGDIGYRMNLFSALNGALAIFFTDRILHRLGISGWASLGALLMLAFSYYYWALSLIAEVYTLHVLLVAATIYALLNWKRDHRPRTLTLAGFILGCSFSNHVSTLLLIPGYVWLLISEDWRKFFTKTAIFAAALGLLAGLSFYLYLPLRSGMDPAFNYAGYFDGIGEFHPLDLSKPQNLVWLIAGKGFSGLMFGYDPAGYKAEAVQFLKLMWTSTLGIGIGPGILGLIVWLRSKWKFGVMSLLMFAGHATFFIGYRTVDKELMFLPCFLIWGMWMAAGFDWMLAVIARYLSSGSPTNGTLSLIVTRVVILAMAAFTCAWNWQLVDQSDNWSAREHGDAILAEVQPDSILIGYWDTIPVVEYLQLVEGQRLDILVINRFLISDQNLLQLIENQVGHRMIYLDAIPRGLSSHINIHKGGKMYLISLD